MPGLIKREDIDAVRDRTDLREIVADHVSLRSAGVGTWKGLCPFHDERTPSFTVRPQIGRYHCFGCGEKGDVFAFVQAMDHVTFSEAVEKLAARLGIELHYEQGSGPRREDIGKRQRLLDAHKVAEEFFREQLRSPAAAAGRTFLTEKGFTAGDAQRFGVGFAPQSWDALLKHLRGKGFTDEELTQTGMFTAGDRGLYDRFRGRVIWPIRTIAGETIGFGARRLFEDDRGPKYLNTPETPLYKKSQVLYGIDLAKKEITRSRRLVVVEGYTDVMACHLAGVGTAVATCGTAFGGEHIKVVRRLLSDDGSGGEVIFTFDGDEAGQKAALKAFGEDQKFVGQTWVAVEPSGQDPNDLRLSSGDEAVRRLIEARKPLFEFAIRATLKNFDLDTIEGRVAALRAAAPVVAGIRDTSIRPAYARELAGWLGMDPEEVSSAVAAALRRGDTAGSRSGSERRSPEQRPAQSANDDADAAESARPAPAAGVWFPKPDWRDPVARTELQALEVVLQQPGLLSAQDWDRFDAAVMREPAHRAVHEAIVEAGASGAPASRWVDAVLDAAPEVLRGLVSQMAVTALPAADEEGLRRYVAGVLHHLFDAQITRQKNDRLAQMQRLDASADSETIRQLQRELMDLELERRALRPQ